MSEPSSKNAAISTEVVDNARFKITTHGGSQVVERVARGGRETVESIVVAIILALLFRSFVAEAFVIPTGSMAPTLQGRHRDIKCPQCNFRYRAGASIENPGEFQGRVQTATCPNCRFTYNLAESTNINEFSFNGDRILVSKFAYALSDPKRWEVIVFKFPGNAKQNYIKRLVGLPGEVLMIQDGDIFIKKPGEDEFKIARKLPSRQRAMMQLVHDTQFLPDVFVEAGLPSRWQPWVPGKGDGELLSWQGSQVYFDSGSEGDQYLRYRHYALETTALNDLTWNSVAQLAGRADLTGDSGQPRFQPVEAGQVNEEFKQFTSEQRLGSLITDYYAYNDFEAGREYNLYPHVRHGAHWVGDLAIEANVVIKGNKGELLLKAVEGGIHFDCRIDVSTGTATLTGKDLRVPDQGTTFEKQEIQFGDSGKDTVTAQTNIKGPGNYWVRFANVDNQIRLWINNRLVNFDSATTYQLQERLVPYLYPLLPDDRTVAADPILEPGDLAPLGIGSNGLSMLVERARVFRDVYYVAGEGDSDDYEGSMSMTQWYAMNTPSQSNWGDDSLFHARRSLTFEIPENGYFPLGDNSPQSQDARYWGGQRSDGSVVPSYVEKRLLIGRAFVVYWPHGWRIPIPGTAGGIPIVPNFERMGFIR